MTKELLWEREPHTKAKHDLLLAFFTKWLSIHSSYFAGRGGGLVRVYDGFAGPGQYAGGESGSPLILMRALCTNGNLRTRWSSVRYELRFVEKDVDRADHLEQKLQDFEEALDTRGPGWPSNVSWSVTRGRYEENVPEAVDEPSALFLFLDPFGYSHAPMTLTQGLVQQPKSDTLIFVPFSFVNRFVRREGQEAALDRFFGTQEWRTVPDGRGRPEILLELFERQLRRAGLDWVGAFRLEPDSTNAYFIVGGSGHLAGWQSIKEGFWAVDPVSGRQYRSPSPAPPGQQSLGFDEPEPAGPDLVPLRAGLQQAFGSDWFTVEQAVDYVRRSRFLETHLKRMTLTPAEKSGELEVERPRGVRQFKLGAGIRMRFR
jgi:three-Cys-motif partner protein